MLSFLVRIFDLVFVCCCLHTGYGKYQFALRRDLPILNHSFQVPSMLLEGHRGVSSFLFQEIIRYKLQWLALLSHFEQVTQSFVFLVSFVQVVLLQSAGHQTESNVGRGILQPGQCVQRERTTPGGLRELPSCSSSEARLH